MMGLRILIWKEIYSTLRNPQIIISIIMIPILFIAMGSFITAGIHEAKKSIINMRFAVINNDEGKISKLLVKELSNRLGNRLVVIPQEVVNIGSILGKYGAIFIIPKNFSREVINGGKPIIQVITLIKSFSLSETSKLSYINSLKEIMGEGLRSILIKMKGLNESILKIGIQFNASAFFGTLKMKLEEVTSIISMLSSVGFIIAMMLALTLQLSTLNMAQEKEEKTFEVLLSQPIPRAEIGIAKMVGSIILALIETSVFMISWLYYVTSIIGATGGHGTPALSRISIYTLISGIGGESMVIMLLDLITIMLCGSVLGIIIGGISKDTRSAGIFIGPLWFILIMIGLSIQWLGLPAEAHKLLVLSTTLILSPTLILYSSVFINKALPILILLVNIAELIMLLYLLKRFMESEIIITGYKISRKQ